MPDDMKSRRGGRFMLRRFRAAAYSSHERNKGQESLSALDRTSGFSVGDQTSEEATAEHGTNESLELIGRQWIGVVESSRGVPEVNLAEELPSRVTPAKLRS